MRSATRITNENPDVYRPRDLHVVQLYPHHGMTTPVAPRGEGQRVSLGKEQLEAKRHIGVIGNVHRICLLAVADATTHPRLRPCQRW